VEDRHPRQARGQRRGQRCRLCRRAHRCRINRPCGRRPRRRIPRSRRTRALDSKTRN